MIFTRALIIPTLLFLSSSLPCMERLVYRERTGSRTEIHTYEIEKEADGFRVVLVRRGEGTLLRDECTTDASFSTLTWQFTAPAEKTMVTAVRRGNVIELSGMHEGKEIHRTFRINGYPWKQLFSVDFAGFAALPEGESGFWSIGTAGIGDMKIAEFKVSRRETRKIWIAGGWSDAVCMRIALRGVRSILWHGDYWLRQADGRYLLYEGRNGLFAARTRKELIQEEKGRQDGK